MDIKPNEIETRVINHTFPKHQYIQPPYYEGGSGLQKGEIIFSISDNYLNLSAILVD